MQLEATKKFHDLTIAKKVELEQIERTGADMENLLILDNKHTEYSTVQVRIHVTPCPIPQRIDVSPYGTTGCAWHLMGHFANLLRIVVGAVMGPAGTARHTNGVQPRAAD
jgi:hypothetical protein